MKHSTRIKRFVQHNKTEIANLLAQNANVLPRWNEQHAKAVSNDVIEEYVEREYMIFPIYLKKYFESLDPVYISLYVGEKLKLIYDKSVDESIYEINKKNNLEKDILIFKKLAKNQLNEKEYEKFFEIIEEIYSVIMSKTEKVIDVLFIGDCVFMDIVSFAVPELKDLGVTIRPTYATSKNHFELLNSLSELSNKKFDFVFYSPLTYSFDPNYYQFLKLSSLRFKKKEIESILATTLIDIKKIIGLLADTFDCAIFVHNTANIIRGDNPLKRFINNTLLGKVSKYLKVKINTWISDSIKHFNEQSFKHIYIVDELRLSSGYSSFKLGRYLHYSKLSHPAYFSRIIAYHYIDIIFVAIYLKGKKMVVCDLDETLWAGVIGEGDVVHYTERQNILLKLKSRGIILSVNSKNDPENVKWNGGCLSESDFVYQQISWQPKVEGFKNMVEDLNITTKDYVFIDDRSDERAMANEIYPEMLCLDPNDEVTWERFNLWYEMLDANNSVDKTRQYQERTKREHFLSKSSSQDDFSMEERFKKLEINLKIRRPELKELKRVEELISKTNQFNTRGVKISQSEIREMYNSKEAIMLIGEYDDKFGYAGIISCIIATKYKEFYSIDYFVLSCRVFGYKIETAMLTELKMACDSIPIKGEIIELERNMPCRNVFRDNGFIYSDGVWHYRHGETLPHISWLNVIK